MAATADQINATIDRYVAVFSQGDKDGYLGRVRGRGHGGGSCGQRRGHRGDRDRRLLGRRAGSDAQHHAGQDGRSSHRGGEAAWSLRAIADLGGTKMAVDIIDVMAFDDEGQVTSLRAYWDMAEMAPYQD